MTAIQLLLVTITAIQLLLLTNADVQYECYIVCLLLSIRMLRLVEGHSPSDGPYCLKEDFVIKPPENTNSAVRNIILISQHDLCLFVFIVENYAFK